MRDTYAPLVWQCRYSGIEVPDELWRYVEFGPASTTATTRPSTSRSEPDVLREFDDWIDAFARTSPRKAK